MDQRASTASIILMDPVSLLGRKEFHQSTQRLSPAGGAEDGKGERGLEYKCGGPPTGGRGAHKSKGRKKSLKAKMVQVHK